MEWPDQPEKCISSHISCFAKLLNRVGQISITHVITNLRRICLLIFLLPDVFSIGTGSCIAAWLSAPQIPGGIDLLMGPHTEARLLLSPSCYTSMASRMLAYPPIFDTARCPLHTVKQKGQQWSQMTKSGRNVHDDQGGQKETHCVQ